MFVAKVFRMKLLFTLTLTLFSISFLNGCCTKKNCACPQSAILLRFAKTTNSYSYDNTYIVIFKKAEFNNPLDTVRLSVGPPCNGCPYDYQEAHLYPDVTDGDIRDFSYVVFNTPLNIADTIFSIAYTTETFTDKCNTCFLARDEYTCEVSKDHILNINGSVYYSHRPDFVFKP